MLLFGAIFSVSEDPRFDFYVQNQDIIDGEPSPLSATFVGMLNETGVLKLKTVDPAEDCPIQAGRDLEGEVDVADRFEECATEDREACEQADGAGERGPWALAVAPDRDDQERRKVEVVGSRDPCP